MSTGNFKSLDDSGPAKCLDCGEIIPGWAKEYHLGECPKQHTTDNINQSEQKTSDFIPDSIYDNALGIVCKRLQWSRANPSAYVKGWAREMASFARMYIPVPGIEKLREELELLLRMAEKCDQRGDIQSPQHEWTFYQGKIVAYRHILEKLEAAQKREP